MRVALLLMAALMTQLPAGAAWARIPRVCHRCQTACGKAISECLADAVTSCPKAPRGKAHKCANKARHQCKKATTTRCTNSCKTTGSPVCPSGPTMPTPAACVPYTSTCTAVPVMPVGTTNPVSGQVSYNFNANTGSPGVGGCCVIDGCAGITKFNTGTGGVNLFYDETEFVDSTTHEVTNGEIITKLGVTCGVATPTNVYSLSDIYQINFSPDLPFLIPPPPGAWTTPYVASPDGLSVSIDSADAHPSDTHNTFTPSTWRLVGQSATVDKVCAEQQLMTGHATASFIKNDGTPCTVTIYSQGTRTVSGH